MKFKNLHCFHFAIIFGVWVGKKFLSLKINNLKFEKISNFEDLDLNEESIKIIVDNRNLVKDKLDVVFYLKGRSDDDTLYKVIIIDPYEFMYSAYIYLIGEV